MNSLELRSKSKDEMLEWRAAIEVAMTPSATSIQEQIDETKDLYSQMADVIQKHIDELGESQSSTALQVCFRENTSFLSQPALFAQPLTSLMPPMCRAHLRVGVGQAAARPYRFVQRHQKIRKKRDLVCASDVWHRISAHELLQGAVFNCSALGIVPL